MFPIVEVFRMDRLLVGIATLMMLRDDETNAPAKGCAKAPQRCNRRKL